MSGEWLSIETRLRRSRGRDTIHAKDCRRASNTLPWIWAEGRSLAELLAACNANGLRRCSVCDPLWEDDSRSHTVRASSGRKIGEVEG